MKEKDIRERIHTFLKDTVRYVVVPASIGIGLALVGCSDSALNASQDGSADSSAMQTGGAVPLYMGAMQGGAIASGGVAQTGGAIATGGTTHPVATGGVVAVYSAPILGGATASGGATGTGGTTHLGSMGGMVVVYGTPMRGGATASGGVPGTGGVTGGEKYSAPMPSGGTTASGGVPATGGTTQPIGGMVTDYSAPMPTGGMTARGGMTAVPLYMGSFPVAGSADAGPKGTGGMMVLLYMAQMPDAAVMRYAAPVPAYMAPLPDKN